MMRTRRHSWTLSKANGYGAILLVLSLMLVSACDNTVEPIAEDRIDAVAVYGFLDMRTDRQVVRLESLRSTILDQTPEAGDLRVRSIKVGTATFQEWSDSLATNEAGDPISVFVANFTPEAGAEYRLEVSRDGDIIAEARTLVPEQPRFLIDPAEGDEDNRTQTLYLLGINGAPEIVFVHYTVIDIGESEPETISVSYGRLSETPITEANLKVNYWSDRFNVMNQLGRDLDESGVQFRRIELSFDLPGPEWFNPTQTTVSSGLGFFGSVGQYRYTWDLDAETVAAMGWIDSQ